jgi:hypothetical protein
VLRKRRAEVVVRWRTEMGGRGPRDVDGVPVAGGQESGDDEAERRRKLELTGAVVWAI